jgi:hypothetical protein
MHAYIREVLFLSVVDVKLKEGQPAIISKFSAVSFCGQCKAK